LIDEAGVHIVFGHSSHHPLAVEVYRNRPILYGCGDCLNDYEGIVRHAQHRPDLSGLYFVRLEASRLELSELTLVPLQTRGFQLRRASDDDARWLSETINRGGAPVPIEEKLRRWARLRRTRFNCRWQVQPDNSLRLEWR
jgi:poly-gamma-glutamate synthesis protein (capsule biosynthesis protein)